MRAAIREFYSTNSTIAPVYKKGVLESNVFDTLDCWYWHMGEDAEGNTELAGIVHVNPDGLVENLLVILLISYFPLYLDFRSITLISPPSK